MNMEQSPILIIDDDKDDLELIQQVAATLNIERPIYYFQNGKELHDYLREANLPPFLIICDVNLPGEDGFSIRLQTAEDTKTKYSSVPFIFWSTDASEKQIQHAYDLPAQGFFFKPSNFEDLCDTFKTILAYWKKSKHPKKVV